MRIHIAGTHSGQYNIIPLHSSSPVQAQEYLQPQQGRAFRRFITAEKGVFKSIYTCAV